MLKEVDASFVAKVIPPRRRNSRKGENGVVLCVGGSRLYHGAPILMALAAYRTGVDLVYLAVPRVHEVAARSTSPSLIVIPMTDLKLTKRVADQVLKWLPSLPTSAAVGPGLSIAKTTALQYLVGQLTSMGAPVVLDAGALVPEVLETVAGKKVVLTPHAGEFKRLFGRSPGSSVEERAKAALEEASRYDLTVLLKGPVDVITDGEELFLNRHGSPNMTVGGTGDVLTGIVAGLLAKGVGTLEAAVAAAYVNGICGEMAERELGHHLLPTDLLPLIPKVMMSFETTVD
ncbi:MAG: NAD(P)H-hydrate dehydratase [Thaumarchaeota archaeon]|nr:NAD(P)H-hydrate dehydratase [Candidatus Calditenuaceae archaeon]MDW8187298.1 NAD(P)H-hydrate dehydratase [Nitrososphaerota archaeon]